jgi:peptidoglycan hydrolase CwlO-like protein
MLKKKKKKCEWLEENINKTSKDILEAYNRIYKRKEAV